MNTELFKEHEVAKDSPRVVWMKKHGVKTHNCPDLAPINWCAWERSNYPNGDENGIPNNPELCGYGPTEDDAIADMARLTKLKLWNEEGL